MTTTLPLYACHKTVRAARIERILDAVQGLGASLKLAGIERPFRVSAEFVDKHDPVAGGYLVVDAAGTPSFAPAAEFDGSHSPVEAPPGVSGVDLFRAVVLPKLRAAQELAMQHEMPIISIVGVEPLAEIGVGTFFGGDSGESYHPALGAAVRILELLNIDQKGASAIIEAINAHPAFGGHGAASPLSSSMH
jgi:hypothetical protein